MLNGIDGPGGLFGRPEEHLFERRLALQVGVLGTGLGQRAVEEAAALVQDEQVRAEVFHERQQVRADEDRGARARRAARSTP